MMATSLGFIIGVSHLPVYAADEAPKAEMEKKEDMTKMPEEKMSEHKAEHKKDEKCEKPEMKAAEKKEEKKDEPKLEEVKKEIEPW